MIKFYRFSSVLIITLFLSVLSCVSENGSDSEMLKNSPLKKDVEAEANDIDDELSINNSDDIYSIVMVGYIGDAKITVDLKSDGLSLNGSYYYNKYKKPITLTGEYEEGADWGPMSLTETNEKDEITGYWDITTSNQRLNYVYNGIWKNPKTNDQLTVILYDKTDNMFLDNDSRMKFESQNAADSFFTKYQFLNHQTYNKPGYIIADNFELQYENPLPIGITIWSAHSYNFDEDIAYTLLEGRKVKNQETGDTVDLAELTKSNVEIDYEIQAFRFQFMNNDKQFVLEDGYRQIVINAVDLENYGYHAVGEGQWYKDNSGSVLGYFSGAKVNYFNKDSEDLQVTIFEKPDVKSSILLQNAKEELGYFSVIDVKLVGIHYWAKVRYDYHKEVPCDETILDPKPFVVGWIRFYDDSRNVTLDYYTRGC